MALSLAVEVSPCGTGGIAHNVNFKRDLIKQSYEGNNSGSFWKDEMPMSELQNSLNDTNFKTDSTFLDAVMSHATNFTPLPNGPPVNAYQAGFENQFKTRINALSIPVSHYTYLTIPFAPETYGGWFSNWELKPMVVIPGKDFESDSIGGVPNPYLPIKGYILGNNSQIDTVTFADEFAIKTKQGATYLIVIVNFEKKDPPAGTSDGNCAEFKNCGDEFCSFQCGEDSNNCKTGECKDRYHLNLEDVALEKDVRYKCGSTFEPLRENYLRGKYALNFVIIVYHCNGSYERCPFSRFAKWKRRELEKEHQDCNSITQTATGTRTNKHNPIRISDMFKPWGGNKSDRIYVMFYEDDARISKTIEFLASNNGHTNLLNMDYTSCPKENPYGYKLPYSKKGDFEPVPNQGWNHIMEIKGSDFIPTGPYSGTYTYTDIPNPNGRGTKHGLSFTMTYTRDH